MRGVRTFSECNRRECEMRRYACGWESQRDSAPKPRVARNELPWERFGTGHNPKGVASRFSQSMHPSHPAVCPGTSSTHSRIGLNPVGVEMLEILSPRVARSDLATLGFEAKSLWDFSQKCPNSNVRRPAEHPWRCTELFRSARRRSVQPRRPRSQFNAFRFRGRVREQLLPALGAEFCRAPGQKN